MTAARQVRDLQCLCGITAVKNGIIFGSGILVGVNTSYKQFMKFGNWKITATTIEWSGEGLNRFVIEMQALTETVTVKPFNDNLYKWIVLALNEDWLPDDDLYDLNFAFVFAAGTSGQPFDYQVFDRTLEYQFTILDDEEE